MKNFGIEYEFFCTPVAETHTSEGVQLVFIPAYSVTDHLDGNPMIGELKTKIFNDPVKLIFHLKRLIFEENRHLVNNKMMKIAEGVSEFKITKEDLLKFRKDQEAIGFKELEFLEEFSVYGKSTGKLLPRTTLKASLQLNISDNSDKVFFYTDEEKVDKDFKYSTSDAFNFIPIIKTLDKAFKEEIKAAGRVQGVFALKPGEKGMRVEYRSLPSNIDLMKLLDVLLTIK